MARDNQFIKKLREQYRKATESCNHSSQEVDASLDSELVAELERKFDELFGPIESEEDENLDNYKNHHTEEDVS